MEKGWKEQNILIDMRNSMNVKMPYLDDNDITYK